MSFLIDGYNFIHSQPHLKSLFSKNIYAAIDALVHLVSPIHDASSSPLLIILDGNQPQLHIQYPTNQPSLQLLFTPKNTPADALILRILHSKPHSKFQIVTQDLALASSLSQFPNASLLLPHQFLDSLRLANSKLSHSLHHFSASHNKPKKPFNNPFQDLPPML